MLDACLLARAHYVDITGEIDVFTAAQNRHNDAQVAGVVVCPGVGFDVIPTDCVAACLIEALPDATRLALGFRAVGARSPGTARTGIEGVRRARASAATARSCPSRSERVPARSTSARARSSRWPSPGAMSPPRISRPASRISRSTSPRRRARSNACDASTGCARCCGSLRCARSSGASPRAATPARRRRNGRREDLCLGRGAQRRRRHAHGTPHDTQWISADGRRRADGRSCAAGARAGRGLLHAVAAPRLTLRRAAPGLQRDPDRVISAPLGAPLFSPSGNLAAGISRGRRRRCSTSGCAAAHRSPARATAPCRRPRRSPHRARRARGP